MMKSWLRVIREDDTTYTDVSLDNQDASTTTTLDIVAAEDALYIGKHYPFNNFYYWVNTANTEASTMSISYWNGTAWQAAVDILDGTSLSGATLGRSGVVQFSPDKDYTWSYIQDTSDTSSTPTELRDQTIYNMYWLKITFSADLTAATKYNAISYAFCNDYDLSTIDYDISSFLTYFSQSDWTRQILQGSEDAVGEFRARGLIINEGDIIRLDDVNRATAFKVMELIYLNLGSDYDDKRKDMVKGFNAAMKSKRFTFDKDNDAFVDRKEINNKVTKLVR